ncbi:MAG: 50S ribosomal protein L6 [Vulcanibacillus sp.]
MSRIGKMLIEIPPEVEVNIIGTEVTVKGPKGTLTKTFSQDMKISKEDNQISVKRPSDNKLHRSLHGTTRSIINNMVSGVNTGFEKRLELVGIGYRVAKSGDKITLSVGYSHQVEFVPEEGIDLDVIDTNKIVIRGIDKQRVGETAAKIRSIREPEPYKGKGIKYSDEKIRRKVGKTGK